MLDDSETKRSSTDEISPLRRVRRNMANPSFDDLPDSAFIRESQLVQSRHWPDNPVPLPFSAPTLWRKVKDGSFPAPCKLSARVTAWKVGSVRDWLHALESQKNGGQQ